MNPPTRLAQIFDSASLEIGECSQRTGIPFAWVRDLLDCADELEMNFPLRWIRPLADFCNVRPSFLFTEAHREGFEISAAQLLAALKSTLAREGMSSEQFSEKVGYTLRNEAGEWTSPGGWNIKELRGVCEFVKVDWLDVIEGI